MIVETRVDGEGERETSKVRARGKALGKGGFALVYAVEETMTGKEYACKWWRSRRWRRRARAKMRTEIRIHKSVACEHVVRFERCFEDDMHVYILMEKCSSRTLADVVKSRGGVEPRGERVKSVLEAVAATAYLHSMRVIHRDLKQGNLFLTDEGLAEIKAEGGGPGTRESLGKQAAPKRLKMSATLDWRARWKTTVNDERPSVGRRITSHQRF